MDLSIAVAEIMTADPITVAPSDSMKKVERLFSKHRIHHLPVVDEGRVVGIVSYSDYLFFRHQTKSYLDVQKEEFRLENFPVGDLMVTGLAKMEPKDSLAIALKVFRENVLHAILIVEDSDRLRGVVTPHDIINYLLNLPAHKG